MGKKLLPRRHSARILAVVAIGIMVGSLFTALWGGTALAAGGTVVGFGDYSAGELNVGSWTNIIQISSMDAHVVGLKSDGTVVAAGVNAFGECNVGSWTNIIQVSAGGGTTLGLKSDGTVVGVGNNLDGRLNVVGFTGIKQVSAGHWHSAVLRSNGTVVATGNNWGGQCDVSGWTDIIQVSAGYYDTVGLKSDGTVVAVGDTYNDPANQACPGFVDACGASTSGETDVSGWTDIIQVSAGDGHTLGLKSDHTVVAAGDPMLQAWISQPVHNWQTGDIIQVASGAWDALGLKSDGTVVSWHESALVDGGAGDWYGITQVAVGWGDDYAIVNHPGGMVTNAAGADKYTFYQRDNVYCIGYNFVPNSTVDVYVVPDDSWTYGQPITKLVTPVTRGVHIDANGNLPNTMIWPARTVIGQYDIIFDTNRDGTLEYRVDVIDNPLDPGFEVVGDPPSGGAHSGSVFPSIYIAAIAVAAAGVIGYAIYRRKVKA